MESSHSFAVASDDISTTLVATWDGSFEHRSAESGGVEDIHICVGREQIEDGSLVLCS